MKNRFLFRDNGHVIRTRRPLPDAWFALACTAVLLGLLAWGHAADNRDERASFEAGVATGRAEMAETVASAYRQGAVDAMATAVAPGSSLCAGPQSPDDRLLRTARRDVACAGGRP